MIKKRGMVSCILLSILTAGIYSFYWIYALARDLNTVCSGDGKNTAGLLKYLVFGILTLGIYNIVWIYMIGDRMQANGDKYNVSIKEGGSTILLWSILGSFIVIGPFVALYMIINNMNKLAEAYNTKISA